MRSLLRQEGFKILPQLLIPLEIEELRREADAVAREAGSTCVRRLRDRSELFDAFIGSDKVKSWVPESYVPVRSILFDKTAKDNWPVLWHQDLIIAVSKEKEIEGYGPWSLKDGVPHVQPPENLLSNMITVRLHLDDTPAANGALIVIPSSHKIGKLASEKINHIDRKAAITCECSAGDALIMSPLLLHSSKRAEKPSRRRIIHIEFALNDDLDPRLEWYE